MATPIAHTSLGHARRSFWTLTFLAVAATGSLTAALAAPTGTLTGIRVAVSGLVLVVTAGLATRVLVVVERTSRRTGGEQPSPD
jgi:hypothetical protein